jgi:hypothetical protein
MLHHIVLLKLKAEVTSEKIEAMMRQTRISLLKIPEALTVKCGRAIDPNSEWGFFIAIDCESTERLNGCLEDPIYIKYFEEIIKPSIVTLISLDYEMEPAKDIRYS